MVLVNVGHRRPMYPLVTPPMGALFLGAYLRQKLDLDIRVFNQRVENWSDAELARHIVDLAPDIVGLGTLTPAAHALPGLTGAIRTGLPDALILLGGPHASSFRERVLEDTCADAAVAGEGELSFEALIRAWTEGTDFSSIPGLMWRDRDGRIVTNPGVAPVVANLDDLPFPAYDLIDLPRYWHLQSMPPIPRRRYASLVTSRGCPYRCSWCHDVFGKRFRAHSAERVADEIQHLQRTYGIRDFEFLDDIFNLDRARLHAFADLVARRDLGIKLAFPNGIRSDTLTEADVDALVSVGTYFCSFALESGSPRIQKHTGKNLDIPRFLRGVEMSVKRGVFANGFMMLGFPTETAAEMQMTIDVASESRLHTGSFFTATPFPNTTLYDMAAQMHPDRLARLRYDDGDFSMLPVNMSAEPDEVLFYYQRRANRQFFGNPRRLLRILRDFPQPHLLPMYVPVILTRLTKGLLGRDRD